MNAQLAFFYCSRDVLACAKVSLDLKALFGYFLPGSDGLSCRLIDQKITMRRRAMGIMGIEELKSEVISLKERTEELRRFL